MAPSTKLGLKIALGAAVAATANQLASEDGYVAIVWLVVLGAALMAGWWLVRNPMGPRSSVHSVPPDDREGGRNGGTRRWARC